MVRVLINPEPAWAIYEAVTQCEHETIKARSQALKAAAEEILSLPDPLFHLALELYEKVGFRRGVRHVVELCQKHHHYFDAFYGLIWLGKRTQGYAVACLYNQHDGACLPSLLEDLIPQTVARCYTQALTRFRQRNEFGGVCFPLASIWTAARELASSWDAAIGIACGGLSSAFGFRALGWDVVIANAHRQGSEATFAWHKGRVPRRLKGKRILLLDKDAVTGETLRRVVKEVQKLQPERIGVFFNHDPAPQLGTRLEAVPRDISPIYYPRKLDYKHFLPALAFIERKYGHA